MFHPRPAKIGQLALAPAKVLVPFGRVGGEGIISSPPLNQASPFQVQKYPPDLGKNEKLEVEEMTSPTISSFFRSCRPFFPGES